jgi:hypothetical protein
MFNKLFSLLAGTLAVSHIHEWGRNCLIEASLGTLKVQLSHCREPFRFARSEGL